MWLCLSSNSPALCEKKRTLTHMTERNQEFQVLFREHGIENAIFERVNGRESTFDHRCKRINKHIRNWKNREQRQVYIRTFSIENWKKLSRNSKKRHTLKSAENVHSHLKSCNRAFQVPLFPQEKPWLNLLKLWWSKMHWQMLLNKQ